MKKKVYIITVFPKGSGIENTPETLVTVMEFSTEDEEFKNHDEFEEHEFDAYIKCCVDEECAEREQHWANNVALTEEQFKLVQGFKG